MKLHSYKNSGKENENISALSSCSTRADLPKKIAQEM